MKVAFLAWLVAYIVTVADLGNGTSLKTISGTDRAGITAGGNSFQPILSADGRTLVFVSHANNLVTNDNHALHLDVFARNLESGRTTLVSVNASGVGGGNDDSVHPSISADGRYIAFASEASDLVSNDTNSTTDVFVRDLATGTTTPVSTGSPLTVSQVLAARSSADPQISTDGRWIVFSSRMGHLVSGDTNGIEDVFVRDLEANSTLLVSAGMSGSLRAMRSGAPSINSNGTRIAFFSNAENPELGVTNRGGDIYLWRRDDTSLWASKDVGAYFAASPYRCFHAVISPEGRSVVFKASDDDQRTLLFHFREDTLALTLLSNNTWSESRPAISADGRFVASEEGTSVYRWDVATGIIHLISVSRHGDRAANGASHSPVMTPDGQSVAFLSDATDLTAGNETGEPARDQLYVRSLSTRVTKLVTTAFDGAPSRTGVERIVPALSADGGRVAFDSVDGQLTPNDFNRASDVFLRSLSDDQTILVSERVSNLPALTSMGFSRIGPGSVSADGNVVAFTRYDGTLVQADTNRWPDVFVRNLQTGALRRINTGMPRADGGLAPQISADGRRLTFLLITNVPFPAPWYGSTVWMDLKTGRMQHLADRGDLSVSVSESSRLLRRAAINADGSAVLYEDQNIAGGALIWRDVLTGSNEVVSITSEGMPIPDSTYGALSPDGRWAVFSDAASARSSTGLSTYARDLITKNTQVLGGFALGFESDDYFSFSADSRVVAFASLEGAVVHDLYAGTNLLVAASATHPSLSGDGRLVVFEERDASIGHRQVKLRNLGTGTTNLISVNAAGTFAGNGHSRFPLITFDGRYVVFASEASDLVPRDHNGVSDIFVRDVIAGTTMLISANPKTGASGDGPSSQPFLGADGRTVVFQSFASDLTDGDYNDDDDVFVLRLGSNDSDGDGLEDDWEMTYFGTLARDGTGDFDSDGINDRGEFVAGTNPTNSSSILRVLTITSLETGAKRLLWSAAPGKRYRVEFKTQVEDSGWDELAPTVVAAGSTASFVDLTSGSHPNRFYRVVPQP